MSVCLPQPKSLIQRASMQINAAQCIHDLLFCVTLQVNCLGRSVYFSLGSTSPLSDFWQRPFAPSNRHTTNDNHISTTKPWPCLSFHCLPCLQINPFLPSTNYKPSSTCLRASSAQGRRGVSLCGIHKCTICIFCYICVLFSNLSPLTNLIVASLYCSSCHGRT